VHRFATASTEPQRSDVDSVAPSPPRPEVATDALTGPSEKPARRTGFSHAVEDVFSRWKQPEGEPATTEPASENGEPLAAPDRGEREPRGAKAEPAPGRAKRTRPAVGATGDTRAQVARHTRDAVLAGIARDLSRHLKLALSDEQNVVLERLRDVKTKPPAPELVDELGRSDRYVAVVRRELLGALEAGWRTVRVDEGGLDGSLLDPVVGDVVAALTGPLHERLAEALEGGRQDEGAAERVRNLYREVRNDRAAVLSDHAALRAFAAGQYAAARQLSAQRPSRKRGRTADKAPTAVLVRWASDGCTPDCDDNALAGPVPVGETFPTEHHHPPAFVGCRCLLVVERPEGRAGGPAPKPMKNDVMAEEEEVHSAASSGGRGHLPATAV
jgi:hypothetical protein